MTDGCLLITGTRFAQKSHENDIIPFIEKWVFGVGQLGIEPIIIVGCAEGVDAIVRQWCSITCTNHKIFEADWKQYGKFAGSKRNMEMIKFCKNYKFNKCLGFPMFNKENKGTFNCISNAIKNGIKTEMFLLK